MFLVSDSVYLCVLLPPKEPTDPDTKEYNAQTKIMRDVWSKFTQGLKKDSDDADLKTKMTDDQAVQFDSALNKATEAAKAFNGFLNETQATWNGRSADADPSFVPNIMEELKRKHTEFIDNTDAWRCKRARLVPKAKAKGKPKAKAA